MELVMVGHTFQTVRATAQETSGWSWAAKKLDATKKLDLLEKDKDFPFPKPLASDFCSPSLSSLGATLAGRESFASKGPQRSSHGTARKPCRHQGKSSRGQSERIAPLRGLDCLFRRDRMWIWSTAVRQGRTVKAARYLAISAAWTNAFFDLGTHPTCAHLGGSTLWSTILQEHAAVETRGACKTTQASILSLPAQMYNKYPALRPYQRKKKGPHEIYDGLLSHP
ncbi:hypothetical protein V8C42DRAFT_322105 [Trichoderma barbatum]